MKTNIKATGIELTEAISDYALKRLEALEKYLGNNEGVVAEVELGRSTKNHKSGDFFKAEIHLSGGGIDLYAVAEESTLYAAIDLVKDEMVRNLTQDKGKKETMARRGGRMLKDMMRGLNFFKRRR